MTSLQTPLRGWPHRPFCRLCLRIFALAAALLLLLELLNHRLPAAGLRPFLHFLATHPWAAAVDLLLVLMTLVPACFLRRRAFFLTLISVAWLAFGCGNGFIRLKRSTPLTVSDLAQLRTGIDTLPNYLPLWAMILLAAAILAILAGLVVLFLRGPRNALPRTVRLRQGLAAAVVTALSLALCWGCASATNQLSRTFPNLSYAYDDYGFPYCFLQTALNRGIRRPANYGSRRMAEIAERIPAAENQSAGVNILFIQLESLVDPENVEGLRLTEDAMPNLRALEEDYSSGYLTVPVVGASTANTEFEVLTGMRCRFFGPGEYPYKSRAQKMPIESVASDLTDIGYAAHAVHNNRAAFYARNTVYANLGFQDFTAIEYMPETPLTPNGWSEDAVLTSQILQAMDLTEGPRDFVFTVTVQCHGNYSTEEPEDPVILVTDCPENINQNSMTYYVNQLRETDAFVGELVAALEARGEPTVAVFYGDHLPSLNLTAAQLENGSMYQTEYVIWDNLGLTKKDENLGAFQLAAEVLERLGLSGGTVLRFHQACKDTPTYQSDLWAIEYDLLYGRQYLYRGGKAPEAADLRLGTADITVDHVLPGSGCFYVLGQNFTPYCRVASGGDALETEYLNGYCLRVREDLSEIDPAELSIQVIDKYRTLLSEFDD